MYSIKIAGQSFTIPEDVSELTLSQFMRIRSGEAKSNQGIVDRMAAVFNVESKTVQNIPFTINSEKEFAGAVALTKSLNASIGYYFSSDVRFITPKSVSIGGKNIKVPEDIQELPWWPSRIVKQIIQEVSDSKGTGVDFDPTDRISDVLCHYMYVPYLNVLTESKDNQYEEKHAEEFKKLIMEMKVTDAVPLANFFFLKWKKLYLSRTGRFLTRLLIWKKRLAWNDLKSLAI